MASKEEKGKGQGKKDGASKGSGKKGKPSEKGFTAKGKAHAMLDFNTTHETQVEEKRQQAVKLLEQLKCSRELIDGERGSKGLEARELDFARGPELDRRSRWRRATAGLGFRLLRTGAGVAGFLMLLSLVAVVTLGLPVPQTAAALASH